MKRTVGTRLAGRLRERRPRRHLIVRALYFRGPVLVSALRKRWVVVRHPHVDVRFGPGTYLGPRFSLHAPFGGTFHTGPGVEFRRGFRAELGGADARITIGARSAFTYDVVIQCAGTVEVGEECLVAQAVMIVDGSHRFRDPTRPIAAQGYDLRRIRIGNGAAIAAKCTVIADVGERAFIAANAVVTRPVPPWSLAAGVPARVLEQLKGPASGSVQPSAPHSARSG